VFLKFLNKFLYIHYIRYGGGGSTPCRNGEEGGEPGGNPKGGGANATGGQQQQFIIRETWLEVDTIHHGTACFESGK